MSRVVNFTFLAASVIGAGAGGLLGKLVADGLL
jgi:hypothetical protein